MATLLCLLGVNPKIAIPGGLIADMIIAYYIIQLYQ